MSIIHIFKDHIFGFKITPKAWFYLSFCQSYEWLHVHTLETLNSRNPLRKFTYSLGWYEMQISYRIVYCCNISKIIQTIQI